MTPITFQVASEPVNKLFAITTYHPTEKSFRKILQEDWDLLGTPATRGLYEAKVIYGHRRPKNLQEHLVRAAIKPLELDASKSQTRDKRKETRTCKYRSC